ncbi:unnamed protein product [Polarella glacialis]|uniref:Uncharacterized protein n=1 Tax=Polarella glacialis TaxID=89957 RepID=A0A813KIC9_POLGL|nr:unnamed protein product [Polarella glacialis]
MAASAALLLGPVDVETVQQLRVQGGLFHGASVAEIEGNVTDPWAVLSRLRGAQGGNAEVLRAYARFLRASHDAKVVILAHVPPTDGQTLQSHLRVTPLSRTSYASTQVHDPRVRINRQLILPVGANLGLGAPILQQEAASDASAAASIFSPLLLGNWYKWCLQLMAAPWGPQWLVTCFVAFLLIGVLANPRVLVRLCFRGGASLTSTVVKAAALTVEEMTSELFEDIISDATSIRPAPTAGGITTSVQSLFFIFMGWVYGHQHV